MPLYDFACPNGHDEFEVRCSIAAKTAELHRCPECGEPGQPVILQAPLLCTTIVPMYPGSKRVSAGTVHTHGDKNATKVMSGPYGMTQPKTKDPRIAAQYQPDPAASVKEAMKGLRKG